MKRTEARLRYRKQIERRQFVIKATIAIGFICANILLGLWGWPKILEANRRSKERRKPKPQPRKKRIILKRDGVVVRDYYVD
jgi:hypothetical protein